MDPGVFSVIRLGLARGVLRNYDASRGAPRTVH